MEQGDIMVQDKDDAQVLDLMAEIGKMSKNMGKEEQDLVDEYKSRLEKLYNKGGDNDSKKDWGVDNSSG